MKILRTNTSFFGFDSLRSSLIFLSSLLWPNLALLLKTIWIFAGLNHTMFDWLKNFALTNQQRETRSSIRFLGNRSLVLKSSSPLTRKIACSNLAGNWTRVNKGRLISLRNIQHPGHHFMDYRPFIYGGLASMTAEFGKAEGTLDRRSKRLNRRLGKSSRS